MFDFYKVPENPRKKYFRIQKSARHKFHIAKRKKLSGNFRSLCGMIFRAEDVPAVTIKDYKGYECGRCQRAASFLQHDHWAHSTVRIVRIRRSDATLR